ncbi:MAG: hypothetical protein HGB11_03500 [Chlorobiales bacterium]|jgi:hypothetical protein|nr:hypothetical protein [Chlorobiales bacterium]
MKKFGQILLEAGYICEKAIETALVYQNLSEHLLGRIMLDMGLITPEQKLCILEHQKKHSGKKFGECAIELGEITWHQFQKALDFQCSPKGTLGEILIMLGMITSEQRDQALILQLSEMGT